MKACKPINFHVSVSAMGGSSRMLDHGDVEIFSSCLEYAKSTLIVTRHGYYTFTKC